ncbi:MAG: hypothetical protein C5B59_09485 [Bacteroidetes bacterium]|nr:MAG: hypothetical protein C5B59_09485 [Bacteroidota bacterium]
MEKFMFLFRGGNIRALSPELMQHHMNKWLEWMETLRSRNILVRSEPLHPTGMVVSGKNKVVTDGPFIEENEMIGGYTIILARDMEEALSVSKNCPIFEMDGKLEIRPLREITR